MKIQLQGGRTGSALLITLLTAMLIGFALATYLNLVSHQNRATMRSLAWNTCMPVLEAGIEEALTHLHHEGLSNIAANDWTALEGGRFVKSRALGDGSGFEVTIFNSDPPVIESVGYVPAPLGSRSVFGAIGAGGEAVLHDDPGQGFLRRKVRVTTRKDDMFLKALLSRRDIDLNGQTLMTDSFDPADPAFSTDGRYDPAKARDRGDVAAQSGLVSSAGDGSVKIKGRIATGPDAPLTLGDDGSVGSAGWVDGGNLGVETGHLTTDLNPDFPDAVLPAANYTATSRGTYDVEGTNYNFVFSGRNFIKVEDLGGKIYVAPDAEITLWVPHEGTVSFSGEDRIVMSPGASLKLYVGAPSATFGGEGILHAEGSLNFQYYGLAENTSLALTSTQGFTGTIYAPHAQLDLGSDPGDEPIDFTGAAVVAGVRLFSRHRFHYDEALGRNGPAGGYIVASWNEVRVE